MQPQRSPACNDDTISSREISRLSTIASREAGIAFGQEKADFLMARLGRLVEKTGLTGYSEYCDLLERDAKGIELKRFLEAITTHTTSFFRESAQYDWLANEGYQLLWDNGVGRSRDLTIWSAACSTGQELYTAIMQTEIAARSKFSGLRYRGIGTDLSQPVVSTASSAVYDKSEISGIPIEIRRNFLLSSKSDPNKFRISPELRQKTEWRLANLTKPGTLSSIDADIIFLRNVLIYFDEPTQALVLRNVLARLRPGGFLLTGHSETASVRKCDVQVIRPTIYRKGAS